MDSEFLKLLELESENLHDERALEAALDGLPAPRSPDLLLGKFCALGAQPGHVIVDLGCGHGQYSLQIASATGATVVAVDLNPTSLVETRTATGHAESGRVHVARTVAEALPLRHGSAGFVWCRDMLNHVDLRRALSECAAVLASGGYMLVYQTFATASLEPAEAARLYAAFAIVAQNMEPEYFEACARDAGFTIEDRDAIASEWREWWEAEGSRKTSANLHRAALLLRGGESIRDRLGDKAYEFALADQLWGIYQMIGKLCPTVYVLRRV
jgi:ubiquinone/menaquinone biosynthesis C-methylase UbiE